jgi:D-threo-aldose 1-dehydrogenase
MADGSTVDASERDRPLRSLGRTGLEVSDVCIGGSPLGGVPELYGHDTDDATAIDAVKAALASPYNFLDTANIYGDGRSERRIRAGIAAFGGLPHGYIVATKVDRSVTTHVFDGPRVRASYQESAERLRMDVFPLLYFHDPEVITYEQAMAEDGPVRELVRLKEEGKALHIGVAGGPVAEMVRYVATGLFDVLLTHNRYTLLDRSAEPLIEAGIERGMGIVNAAPYGGGMLAKGPTRVTRYAYGIGDDSMAAVAARMQEACARRGVSLAAAALQFSVRDERIHSTVVGISSAERIAQTTALLGESIDDDLWAELAALAPKPESWIQW